MTDSHTLSPSSHPFISIKEEMERSYLDYAMSVIVSRALPDVRDGLKPVHRRILYAMMEGHYDWSRPPRKSARVVGDVMGNYHPHGDNSIYDALVRMAQTFSMRVPLIDGQGNFGSVDGDPAAAMRYTESRLARAAELLLRDIDKQTVDFIPNYDETQHEPSVLPAEFPNLLVNGTGGIAVGMATNIPPHNPGEVLRACMALIKNPHLTDAELLQIVPGPDFPTGALIMGRSGIVQAYRTGRGSIIMRACADIHATKNHQQIIITEIPYQVNKAQLLIHISELVTEKTIEGISDIRDESDRKGMRIVIEIKRDHSAEIILNQLFRHTRLQTSFPANMLAMHNGRPQQMGLKTILQAFCTFREDVITRRTQFQLEKARDRAHVLAGLLVALVSIDKVIELIKKATNPDEARTQLMAIDWQATEVESFITLIDDPAHQVVEGAYRFSEKQAKAILELRLQRLTGMERKNLGEETQNLANQISGFLEILSSRDKLIEVVLTELQSALDQLDNPRRTRISDAISDQDDEDLIQQEDVVVTVSHRGYIKRVALSDYRAQRRGGKGRTGMKTREEDFVTRLFVANTHTSILFFTSTGMVYKLKGYKLPTASLQSMGKAMVNLLPISVEDTIQAVMPMPEDQSSWDSLNIVFATARGTVRRNALSDFTDIRRGGKIAIKLSEGDRLIAVHPCHENDHILLASRKGKAIRFAADKTRLVKGRNTAGTRGMRLLQEDYLVSMCVIGSPEHEYILSITENGYGKRTTVDNYRQTGRGGQGVANIEASIRNGLVVASFTVLAEDQVMLVTDAGQVIRIRVDGGEGDTISVTGRKTQGVRLFEIDPNEKVVSVGVIRDADTDDIEDTTIDEDETADSSPPVEDDMS